MSTVTPVSRRGALLLAVATLATVLVASPAVASHQACGSGYPAGTNTANGHPDYSGGGIPGWTGLSVTHALAITTFTLSATKDTVEGIGDIIQSVADLVHVLRDLVLQTPSPEHITHAVIAAPMTAALKATEAVADGFTIAGQVIFIAETAIAASELAVGMDVAEEDACGGTLAGDMTDMLWIALVERNLASSGPPMALLMTPVEGDPEEGAPPQFPLLPALESSDFTWCPEITLPDELPAAGAGSSTAKGTSSTKADCSPLYHTGFLNAPYIGVQAIVRDTIDHAAAHGLLPPDGDPDDGIPSRGEVAESAYASAEAAIENGQYGRAFTFFREAYQVVMDLQG